MKKPLIDKNGEVRELTKEDFNRMRPAYEVFPEIVEEYKKGRLKARGQQKTPTKVQTTLRLSRDVVSFFRTTGRGWQTKLDMALKEYVQTHSKGI